MGVVEHPFYIYYKHMHKLICLSKNNAQIAKKILYNYILVGIIKVTVGARTNYSILQ